MDNSITRYEALLACRDMAGSDSRLGRDLGIPQSTMWRIINSSKQLPAEYVLKAERLYGVSRHDLRPDIYPRDHDPIPTSALASSIAESPILSVQSMGKHGNRHPIFPGKDAA